MTQGWKHWGWQFGIARVLAMSGATTLTECFAITLTGGLALALSGTRASAQIIPDATLGAERSVVTPNANVRSLPAELIEGGAQRGANLFHSFWEFNVRNGQRVYFANPAGIENILGRVTGNNVSKILGTLGVDGGANLFLINPNGIIFGPNARLDIAGSFVGSTANSLVFGNGYQFSATNPQAPPLLTVNLTPGLQYGTNQPSATITNAGHLAVGKDLTLSAGNLNLRGQLYAGGNLTLFAQDTVKVRDRVANPFIAAAGGQLLVQGNQNVDIFALNHPESGLFSGGDMVLRSANTVIGDTHYKAGGSFRVEQLDGSLGNLESPNDPVFEVAGDFSLTNYMGNSLQILAGGSVNIGTVTISPFIPGGMFNDSSVILSDGTLLTISGTTQPTVDIRAGTTVFFGTPTAGTPTSADIKIGNIFVNAPDGLVFLSNQYQPNTALSGDIQVTRVRTSDQGGGFSGNSGSIIIDSRGDITIPDSGTVRTDSITGNAGDITLIANGSFFMKGTTQTQLAALALGQGNAGNINITAGNGVFLTGNAQMAAFTSGRGNAGNINIIAGNDVSLTGNSFISTDARRGAVGNGGNINIQASSLSMDGRAALQADTYGPGNAGSIIVQVNDSVSLTNGGFISSIVQSGGTGQGGDIQIDALGSVNVSGFDARSGYSSALLAKTERDASGQAGRITVNTGTLRVADGAVIDASTLNSRGGGSVVINANSLELTGGGEVLALTRSSGTAGNISLNIADTVTISGSDPTFLSRRNQFGSNVVTNESAASGLFTDASIDSIGDGGDIDIRTRQLVSDGGLVLTASFGTGNAGDLSIIATDSMSAVNQSSVITSSFGSTGDSGNLLISTRQLNVSDGARVATATFGTVGNAGDLSITATDLMNVSNQGLVTTASTGAGDSGKLSISTGTLNITNEGQVLTASLGTGKAGDSLIVAANSMSVSNQGLVSTESKGTGGSGNLAISTRHLDVNDAGQITTASTGTQGKAGDLSIAATDSVNVSSQGVVTTASTGTGDSGNLSISTRQLNVSDPDSVIGTNSFGTGKAGNLAIAAMDSVNVSTGGLVTTGTDESSTGNGGNLSISTRRLDVNNGGLSTAALGQGNAGNLSVVATDSMNVVNQGYVTTSSKEGVAGNLDIETGKLSIRDNSFVFTSTVGSGDSGNLTVRKANAIEVLNGSGLSSATIGSGNGGDVRIETENLVVDGGSKISADTFSSGNGGNLTLETRNLSVLNGGEISTGVFPESSGQGGKLSVNASNSVELNEGSLATATRGNGNAGNLSITTRKLTAQDGGRVESGTTGIGRGGSVTVNASESIELSGSYSDGDFIVFSGVSSKSGVAGNAGSGDVNLTTGELAIRDGAEVTTATLGSGNGGNIGVQANSLDITTGGSITSRSEGRGRAGDISVNLKDNLRSSGGIISATSTQAGGGNVNINASDIRLRNSSLVSTSVFDSTGGGGNISINSKIFIALEDSDILANAFDGRGGDITINSAAFLADLFSSGKAVAVGRNPGDFSPFRGNGRVDISAEATGSGTSGTVTLPTIDLTRGLTQLPSDLVDAESLIDRRCSSSGIAKRSSFTVTGRGGLPPSPNEPLRGEAVTADWISLNSEGEKRDRPNPTPKPTSTTPEQLVEAQGWVIGSNGQVILTAQAPTVTPQNPGLSVPPCQGSQTTTQ